ncbi:MAG: hypothetical protein M1817_006741 [Caeruleum heppii]|nr:MAG: hypothetical protein M1817_006741 [Caeruleum heppii]
MSFRALTRSVPRTFSRLPTSSTLRPIAAARSSSLLHSSWTTSTMPRLTAAFSSSRIRCEKQGEVDEELAAKFDSELQMEKEMRDSDDLPVNIKEYIENGPFEIKDEHGQEDVILTRKFGDEEIRVTFSISDLNALDPDTDRFDDSALRDEDDEDDEDMDREQNINVASAQSGGARSKGSAEAGRTSGGNIAVAPEDCVAPADRPELKDSEAASKANEDEDMDEDDDDEDPEPALPTRLNVTITKPALKGALQIETIAQDGMIVIENCFYLPDAALLDDAPGATSSAPPLSPDQLAAKKGLYMGPPFGNLDEDLQVLLERYLDERGINTAMALFVPDYVDWKEQREYLGWLDNVKKFVEA